MSARCIKCDRIIDHDWVSEYCLRHYAENQFNSDTGLSMDDLPDGLPIEDYVDRNGFLDYDEIGSW